MSALLVPIIAVRQSKGIKWTGAHLTLQKRGLSKLFFKAPMRQITDVVIR